MQKINETVKNYFVSNSFYENTESEIRKIDDAFMLIAEKEFQWKNAVFGIHIFAVADARDG